MSYSRLALLASWVDPRRRASGLIVATIVVSTFCFTVACSSRERDLSNATTEPVPPPDQVVPGEAVESASELFGLALPLGMHISERMQYQGTGVGALPFEAVVNFLRERLTTQQIETGPNSTIFAAASVKTPRKDREGKAYPVYVLRVEARKLGSATEVRVWASEPTPPDLQIEELPRKREESPPHEN